MKTTVRRRRGISTVGRLALCTLLAIATLAFTATATATGATASSTTSRLGLGPTVVKTNDGPTGYSVTFRYDAPDEVASVQLYGEWTFSQPAAVTCQGCGDARSGAAWQPNDIPAGRWTTTKMVKGDDGIWSLTMPLPSGTFNYTYLHDCASTTGAGCSRHLDPANPGWTADLPVTSPQTLSQVYVPSSPRFPTYDNDFQAPLTERRLGALQHVQYTSPGSLDPAGTHFMSVYLPEGYDPRRRTPYPTLYLSHGGGGNDTDWFTQGAAQHIIQRLIDSDDADPMVVVATNYNGFGSANTPGAVQGYVNDLRSNVIPYIETNYNVRGAPEPCHRRPLSRGPSRPQRGVRRPVAV